MTQQPFDQLPEYIIIPMEDDLLHTAENGFCCGSSTCYCANPSDEIHAETNTVEGSLTYVVDETNWLN